MNEERQDEKIRRLFRELRTFDAHTAPTFDATWKAAGNRNAIAAGHPPFAILIAATAIVAALVVVGAIWFQSHRTKTEPIEIASNSLSDWQSPTAFLLQTPGSDVWTSVPSLDQSWMQ